MGPAVNLYRADYIDQDGNDVRPVRDGVMDYLGRDLSAARERAIHAAAIPPERDGLRVRVSQVNGRTLRLVPKIIAHPDGRVTRA